MGRSTGFVVFGLLVVACNGGSSATSTSPEKAPGGAAAKGGAVEPTAVGDRGPGGAVAVKPKANVPTATAVATSTSSPPAGGATEYQASGYPKEMPHGRSAQPTADEWGKAPPVTTKKLPAGCAAKFVREWLQIACVNAVGAAKPFRVGQPSSLFGKASVKDPDVVVEAVPNERVSLVARTMPQKLVQGEPAEGRPAVVRFALDDNRVFYTVGYHWPHGAPFPSVVFVPTTQKVARPGVPDADNQLFFECKASPECGVGLRCCGSASGTMGTDCSGMCDWNQQSQTCTTDADCTDVPPGKQLLGVKLDWTKCALPKGAAANSPKFCSDPKGN